MSETSEQREGDWIEGVAAPEFASAVVGHRTVRDLLTARLDKANLPNAILLSGPRGIGKATLGFQFARQVLAATGDEPADRVDAQVRMGSHPNLFVLRPARRDNGKFGAEILVDEARRVLHELHGTRGRAGHRICIVDAIDNCNANAANALLKIIEEPPADTLFILVSHRPGGLLATIRSRCASFALRPLSEGEVREVIDHHMGEADAALRDQAIRVAGGRPRRAMEFIGLGASEELNALAGWLAAPTRGSVQTVLQLADTFGRGKAEAMAGFARDMLLDWMSSEARDAAHGGQGGDQKRLASVTALWDKAHSIFAEMDIYNVDGRQSWLTLFDAIGAHERTYGHQHQDQT